MLGLWQGSVSEQVELSLASSGSVLMLLLSLIILLMLTRMNLTID